jgi:predicted  nucleic acid-binding Zn-ribbon protein
MAENTALANFNGQKLVYSSKSYSELVGVVGSDALNANGSLFNSIVFTSDGYILTHGMKLKGSVISSDTASGKVEIKKTDDNKGLQIIDANGVQTSSVALPSFTDDESGYLVAEFDTNGVYKVSIGEKFEDLIELVESLEERLDAIDGEGGKIKTIESSIKTIKETIESINGEESGSIATINSQISTINSTIETQGESIQANADAIEVNVKAIEDLTGVVSDNKTAIEESVAAVKATAEGADSKANANATAIEGLQTSVEANAAGIKANKETIDAIINAVDVTATNLSTLNSAINSTNAEVAAVKASVETSASATLESAKDYTDERIGITGQTVKAYVDANISAADAMRYKGVIGSVSDFEAITNPSNGDTYKITAKVTLFGENLESGDMIIYNGELGAWSAVNTNIDGGVTVSNDLVENGVVIATGTHTVKTVSLGNGVEVSGGSISVKGGTGISVDASGINVKLSATTDSEKGVHAVTADTNGNLQVTGVFNTWRTVTVNDVSLGTSSMDLSASFEVNDAGKIDLAWFEI